MPARHRVFYSTVPQFPKKLLGSLAEEDDATIIRSAGPDAVPVKPENRYDERTIQGRSASPGMMYIPPKVAEHVSTLTLDWDPQRIRQNVSALYKSFQEGESHKPAHEKLDVDAQVMGLFLQNFASISSALIETKKRMPANWSPKSILDVGFGPATGLLAANDVLDAKFVRQVVVVLGHSRMTRRAHELLNAQVENSAADVAFKHHVPPVASGTQYDLIIASHQLYQSGDNSQDIADSHAQRLVSLLAPGGVLIMVERGDPLGFESIARARQVIFRPEDNRLSDADGYVACKTARDSETSLRIVAPCQHHRKCPLQAGLDYRRELKNSSKVNWCRFAQNIQRPLFTLELKRGKYLSQPWVASDKEFGRGKGGKALSGRGRPHGASNEQATYSYLVVERARKQREFAKEATENDSSVTLPPSPAPVPATDNIADMPRVLRNPMKRDGHVLMEVCAPSGNIEQWTVTRSQGKQAYHDARKASAGDLWALGAKVVQLRGGLRASEIEKITNTQGKASAPDNSPKNGHAARDYWDDTSDVGAKEPSLLESLSTLAEHDIGDSRGEKLKRKDRQDVFQRWK